MYFLNKNSQAHFYFGFSGVAFGGAASKPTAKKKRGFLLA
jgi:hypothetical protein